MNKNVKIAKELVRIARMLMVASGNFNADAEPTFSKPEEMENGIVVYTVKDSKEGQLAVRKVVDSCWGRNADPWALIARESDSDEELDRAWKYWKSYGNDKKIAFQNGKLLAFGVDGDWYDRKDRSIDIC